MRSRCGGMTLLERRRPVYTHRLARIAHASFKDPRIVVRRHVPRTAHDVVDMLAERSCVRTSLAGAKAELSIRHEVRPFVQLLELAERIREDKPSDRIAIAVCTVRIKLATSIPSGDIQAREVAHTGDLDVVWRLHEVRAANAAVRNDARAIAVLETP